MASPSVSLHLPLYETMQISDRSQVISDQSGASSSPIGFGESITPVNHRYVKCNIFSMAEKCREGEEQSCLYNSQILPTNDILGFVRSEHDLTSWHEVDPHCPLTCREVPRSAMMCMVCMALFTTWLLFTKSCEGSHVIILVLGILQSLQWTTVTWWTPAHLSLKHLFPLLDSWAAVFPRGGIHKVHGFINLILLPPLSLLSPLLLLAHYFMDF